MSFETTAIVLAWVAIVILALAMSGLLRQVRLLMIMLHAPAQPLLGPPLGSVAPVDVNVAASVPTGRQILIFADSECSSCNSLFRHLQTSAYSLKASFDVSVIFRQRAHAGLNHGMRVFENGEATFAAFRIPATPYAVALDEHGRVIAADVVGSTARFDRFASHARERW